MYIYKTFALNGNPDLHCGIRTQQGKMKCVLGQFAIILIVFFMPFAEGGMSMGGEFEFCRM